MYYNKGRVALSVFWLALGIALLGLSIAGILRSEVFSGMGGAFIAVGALRVTKIARYKNDEVYREKVETEAKDERNRFLHMKAWAWTGYLVVMVEALGAVVALIAGQEDIQRVLGFSVCGIIIIYWICYMVLSRKY